MNKNEPSVPDFKHNETLKMSEPSPNLNNAELYTQLLIHNLQKGIDHLTTSFENYDDESHTLDHFEAMVKAKAKPGEDILAGLTPEKCHMWHMASCVPGEGGELFDAIKKYVIYNKALDIENVIEELGDTLFYIQGLIQSLQQMGLHIDLFTILQLNIAKLEKRYGTVYSDQAAQERVDKQSCCPVPTDPTTEND